MAADGAPSVSSAPLGGATTASDGPAAAKAAGLRYVHDGQLGYRRVPRGDGFSYESPDGDPITDEDELARIRKLAVPPAYRDVWVCKDPRGHLQATGRDARGRKQYRYHAGWRALRDTSKYGHLLAFGLALPGLRRRIDRDLALKGMPREKVVAAVLRLLDDLSIRIGNTEYARDNGSFGVTTLRNRHVRPAKGGKLELRFRGKHGVAHSLVVADPKVVQVVKRCLDLPGQDLFGWLDAEGNTHRIGSGDVNAWLQTHGGEDFTAKDFRTWNGSVQALALLRAQAAPDTDTARRSCVAEVIRTVAQHLGNTAAVCRKCYVHPLVIEAWEGSRLPAVGAGRGLSEDERALLALLQQAAAKPGKAVRKQGRTAAV